MRLLRRKIVIESRRVMTISSSITDFLEYMEIEKGRSVSSVKNYDRYLRDFAHFAKQKEITEIEKIDQNLIRAFRLDLNRRSGIKSKNTQNYYLIALRSYLKFLNKRGVKSLDANQIELAKTDERQITFLEGEELDSLLAGPDKSIQGLRDKAILELLFCTGLRVSEAANLKKEDINLEKNEFSVKGKGGKVRVVFLDQSAKDATKKYLAARLDKSEFLFVSYGHAKNAADIIDIEQGMTPRSIQRMVKKYTTMAGITKDVTPHTMRHSFATDLLQNGADLRAVQSLLGHSSITTTQIYTHVTDQHLKDVHEAFHGRQRPQNDNSN